MHHVIYITQKPLCGVTSLKDTSQNFFSLHGGDGGLEINTRLLLLHNTCWVYSQPYQLYTPSTNTCTNIYMLHVSDVIVHHRSRDRGSITGTSLDSSARLAILASPYIMPLMNLSHLHRFKIPSVLRESSQRVSISLFVTSRKASPRRVSPLKCHGCK